MSHSFVAPRDIIIGTDGGLYADGKLLAGGEQLPVSPRLRLVLYRGGIEAPGGAALVLITVDGKTLQRLELPVGNEIELPPPWGVVVTPSHRHIAVYRDDSLVC